MFKKIVSTKGFWRSVIFLGISFAVLFVFIKWAIERFNMEFFTSMENPLLFVLGLMMGGFIYGFFVTYGKFRGKIKKEELNK